MKALYKYYEVVKVVSSKQSLKEIEGKKGAILGMVQNERAQWFYSVQIFDTEEGWDIEEKHLKSTGKIMNREDFYE